MWYSKELVAYGRILTRRFHLYSFWDRPSQVPMLTMSILLGGHTRTGLEDTILYDKGILATNPMLVERVVRIAKELGREIATPV